MAKDEDGLDDVATAQDQIISKLLEDCEEVFGFTAGQVAELRRQVNRVRELFGYPLDPE